MGIIDEDIARVRESTDIAALVGQYTAVKQVGRNVMALCPFHGEKTPSFSISPDKGVYYCFGCSEAGDSITFVRKIETLDFAAAVEFLAGKLGITLRYDKANESADRQRRERLFDACGKAVDWYHERLLSADDAGPARAYLKSRGFTGEEVRRYKLGWAPDRFDALAKALKVPDKVFTDAGLGFINRRNRQQDSFRNRVLFPIFDERDRAVGFGGRIMPGVDDAKYKNSTDNTIYNKSRVLYGLNWARETSVQQGELVVCEGYTDVIGMNRAGIAHAVATCGTSLTEDHVRLLKKFGSRVVLAFDADGAGQAAAERFYQWERDYEIDVYVVDLPDGVDPGDVADEDPAQLQALVEDPVPFLEFRLNRVLARSPMTNNEERARAAEAALDVIAEHPSALVQDQYVVQVADRCRIEPDRLRNALTLGPSRAPVIDLRDTKTTSTGQRRRNSPQHEALRLAIQRPGDIAEWLDVGLFTAEPAILAYRALASAGTFHDALENTDPDTKALLMRLAVEETDVEPIDVVARLLHKRVGTAITELQSSARLADDPLAINAELQMLLLEQQRLYELTDREEAVGRLLDWVREQRPGGVDLNG
jgi:DNA primase